MSSKHKQRGWLQFLAPIAAAAIGGALGKQGQEDTNEANAQQNTETRAFNAAEAHKKRVWDEQMRATQYQTAVGDLRAAGLNPMLAYSQGGAGMPSGATGSAGSVIPMQNATQAGVNSAIAAANIANVHSQTQVNEAQAELIKAQTPQAVASTGNIEQQTKNLQEGLNKISEEIKNVRMDTLEKEERITLVRAQQQLTNIQKDLTKGQITFVQAQEAVARVEAQLKRLEVPGATNAADFERMMKEKTNTGGAAAKGMIGILQGLKGLVKP